jgi:DNA (cytosine-5)-methyltransferase 1|tara:strand:+ start:1809 stop:2753 length:945 start_codon:yes stop_codon:yes gene_type:complete
MLKTLDLFSGIGGFAVGLEATNFFETTCFVEQDSFCQEVLRYHFPEVPILGDIRNVKRSNLPDPNPDVILGGFPCQPFSVAGKQAAKDDPRHLWPEMFRLIKECRPTWVIGENVTGIVKLGLDEVLTDLEGEGYATRTFNIPACAVGAPHLRQRVWIVAHSDSNSEPDVPLNDKARQRILGETNYLADSDSNDRRRRSSAKSQERNPRLEHSGGSERCTKPDPHPTMADPTGIKCKRSSAKRSGQGRSEEASRGCRSSSASANYWETEPQVGRLVDGLSNRVSQLRALGNSIIPQIAEEIGHAIKTAENAQQTT